MENITNHQPKSFKKINKKVILAAPILLVLIIAIVIIATRGDSSKSNNTNSSSFSDAKAIQACDSLTSEDLTTIVGKEYEINSSTQIISKSEDGFSMQTNCNLSSKPVPDTAQSSATLMISKLTNTESAKTDFETVKTSTQDKNEDVSGSWDSAYYNSDNGYVIALKNNTKYSLVVSDNGNLSKEKTIDLARKIVK